MNNYSNQSYAINWENGMKISAVHFIEQYHATNAAINSVARKELNNQNFGLTTPAVGQKSLNLDVTGNATSKIEFSLRELRAVTSAGIVMTVDDNIYPNGQFPTIGLSSSEYAGFPNMELSLLAIISLKETEPFGYPDPEEVPIRHPFIRPKIRLEVTQSSNLNAEFLNESHLIAGKILWNGSTFTMVEDFIPPSTCIAGNEGLIYFHDLCYKQLLDLQKFSYRIIQKVNTQSISNVLAKNTSILVRSLLGQVTSQTFTFKNIIRNAPPIELVAVIASFAGQLQLDLKCMIPKEKEELLSYFTQWYDMKPSEIEDLINGLVNVTYDHNNLIISLKACRQFLNMIVSLWERLSNLEYIGQNKDNIVEGEVNSSFIRSTPKLNIFD